MGNGKPLNSKLLTAAAKEALRPMGLVQRGTSRTWLDDNKWWICAVEFQPSSWSRGTHLNVGCCWLWHVKEYVSFDLGGRVADLGFTEFRDEQQFVSVAKKYAERAAHEVLKYRDLFTGISALSNYYLEHEPKGLWPCYDAGTACALSGLAKEATEFFDRCLGECNSDIEWVIATRDDVAKLKVLSEDRAEFRKTMNERVLHTRALMRLEQTATIDFDTETARRAPSISSASESDTDYQNWPVVGKPLEVLLRRLGFN